MQEKKEAAYRKQIKVTSKIDWSNYSEFLYLVSTYTPTNFALRCFGF